MRRVKTAVEHVGVTRELRSLYAPLKEWIRLNKLIARRWQEEDAIPWWYNERALLGVLTGAIWLTGGIAFEEYSEAKRSAADLTSVGGRVDLLFQVRSGSQFMAEAKRTEVPITRSAHQLERLDNTMRKAVIDAGRNEPDGSSTRIAIAFATPYMSVQRKEEFRTNRVREFVESFDDLDYDAIAWTFPKLRKLPVSESGHVCPGIVLWIKIVKRGQRVKQQPAGYDPG